MLARACAVVKMSIYKYMILNNIFSWLTACGQKNAGATEPAPVARDPLRRL
jgi:hypothetical protein